MGKGLIITEAGQGAPFRKQPTADGEIIGVFEPNTEIDLESYDDGWYAANYEGEQGFVAGQFVQAMDGIEGLDGRIVKAAKKLVSRKSQSKQKAKPTITEAMVKPAEIKSVVSVSTKANNMSPAEKTKLYEANKIVSVERTDKGLKITLEGTAGFNGLAGFDDENLMNGVLKNMKIGISKAVANYKPQVTKITSRGVYEANKQITINRNDNGFQIGIQGINGFDGIDGLEDESVLNGLLKNIGKGIVNTVKKVTGGAKTITETANAVNEAKEAVSQATSQPTQPAQTQANSNLNNSNLTTMNSEQNATPSTSTDNSGKMKKILRWGGIAAGAVVLGFIGFKLLKKKPAAEAAPAAKLSGVGRKKRKKATKKIELS